MKQILITFLLLMCTKPHTIAQITPSIYTGIGTGTNLGSVFGIGSEVRYKSFSLNVATGWGGDVPHSSGNFVKVFTYDVGAKFYTKYNIFGGVNYGDIGLFEKHGFSFTAGYRHKIYKHIYGMEYLGWTPNMPYNPNGWFFLTRHQYLLVGFIVGYEFNSIKIGKQKEK